MEFVWDSKKDKVNVKKHGISFSEAVTVFFDPLAKISDDPDHSNDEDRFIIVGQSQERRTLVVVHVYRSEGNLIRIVSARKATRRERSEFEELT